MIKNSLSSARRLLSAAMFSMLAIGCSGDKATTEHVLELRAGSTTELDGWDRTDVLIGGSRVWMSPDVAVDDEMIETIEKTVDHEGRHALYIRLLPEGAARLERLSVEQLSRPIVVVVDGRPTSAPIVQSPIRSFIITANGMTEDEMDELARRLEHEDR